jgi:glycogen operon protein
MSEKKTTILDLITGTFSILPGHPLPLGVSETRRGLNFAVFTKHATDVTLVLFASGQHESVLELPLDPEWNTTGDVWHIEIAGLSTGTRYGWRVDRKGPAEPGDKFDPSDVLLDPYARAITGGARWGETYTRIGESTDVPRSRRRSLYVNREFDWELVRAPRYHRAERVIYELHVRGFTFHESSGVAHRGTYLGLIEKIPYLKELGITTVELLPVYDFDEHILDRRNPLTGEALLNLWGYSPIGFFAPKASYAVNAKDGNQVDEFKLLIREFHRAGIEVFLDVVFNHTAEGRGEAFEPTYSFRGLDNSIYYILDPVTGEYRDYSGCGNTVNCNHPLVRELILNALRYWVAEMHVDGFRFDLASILGRGQDGLVLSNPPLLERIAQDPVLAGTTIIAEAWDAAGLYQVGSFPAWGRWAEWNGPFRDDIRQFFNGGGSAEKLATRLAGSADLFQKSGRGPMHSVNFVTCHDGFTLRDLVSYNSKHNVINGEDNRDGTDANFSWNCGIEGVSSDPAVIELRTRQTKNLLTVLMLSLGVPMILAGDEIGRSQRGNNNAYCQDNEISWIDWSLVRENAPLFRFVRDLIAFRKLHSVLRRYNYLNGQISGPYSRPDVAWHGVRLGDPPWGTGWRILSMHLAGEHAPRADCDVYFAANATDDDLDFELPPLPDDDEWLRSIDTAAATPDDIQLDDAPAVSGGSVRVRNHSVVVLTSAKIRRQV